MEIIARWRARSDLARLEEAGSEMSVAFKVVRSYWRCGDAPHHTPDVAP
jgi:hypothetical protein